MTSTTFRSTAPAAQRLPGTDIQMFKRGRGDLIFSAFMTLLALFFLAAFWSQTGWQDRKLPDNLAIYAADQLGLIDSEERQPRLGRILKQSWVAPAMCLLVLIPAALWNMRAAWQAHHWRQRFGQPVDARYELSQWLRALEFVGWFLAYTLLVPVLGYLLATLILGTALPWRMGYRGPRWFLICLATSLAIVLVFRTGLQIRTPVNIWLYDQLPSQVAGFMKTWF